MFGKQQGNPVDLVVVEACNVAGKHCAPGEVIEQVDPQTAFDLVSSGRLRVAPEKEKAPAKKPAA